MTSRCALPFRRWIVPLRASSAALKHLRRGVTGFWVLLGNCCSQEASALACCTLATSKLLPDLRLPRQAATGQYERYSREKEGAPGGSLQLAVDPTHDVSPRGFHMLELHARLRPNWGGPLVFLAPVARKKGAGQDEKTGAQECHQPLWEPLFGEGRSSVRNNASEGWLLLT